MAKKKKHVSARLIVAQIRKTRGAVEKLRKASEEPEATRLALKVKKLKQLESSATSICTTLVI